jgi:hypothetical protein
MGHPRVCWGFECGWERVGVSHPCDKNKDVAWMGHGGLVAGLDGLGKGGGFTPLTAAGVNMLRKSPKSKGEIVRGLKPNLISTRLRHG